MSIKFSCPSGHRLEVNEAAAGTRVLCPGCGAAVNVPRPPADYGDATPGGSAATRDPRELYAAQQRASVVQAAEPLRRDETPHLDPIDEAPDAVWYVRPPSGGQFGPAAGWIMRNWIAEGRVPADALVWRAGWPQWQAAAAVFPGQGALLAAPPLDASEELTLGTASTNGRWAEPEEIIEDGPADSRRRVDKLVFRNRMRREQFRQTVLVSSVVLFLVAVILVIVLVVVLK